MDKYEFFSKFHDALIIINEQREILYKNSAFKRAFPDFSGLKSFSHRLNFEICLLDGTNIEMFSPIYQALISAENFFAQVNYQNIHKELSYYTLTSVKRNRYTVLILHDINAQNKLEKLEEDYKKLETEFKKLKHENKNFIKIKQKAQSQAIKMALTNKISNAIRESNDISKIINAAIAELSTMFGAFKVYYASILNKSFKIEQSNKEYKNEIENIIKFDDETYKKITNKKIVASNCLKEYNGATNFKTPTMRIIVPIYHLNQLLGIIVILSNQARELNDEIDILESVSAQLGNAIIRAKLYEKDLKTMAELQTALKELKDTQVQLINSEKMASLGQLIAGVAHEINTPLASINSNNSIMSKIIKKLDENEFFETIKEINELDKEAVARISNIVKSLKKFVRLDEAELQEADINKELDLTLELMRHETKNRIKIIKNYTKLPLIKCYPNMLNQVFMNVLINACQSILNEGEITITTEFNKKNLIVKIKDNGKGIAENKLDKIFTAGYTTKGVGVGTGLGLAISQKIVQKHNGTLKVTSEEGIGSEFIITIPSE